VEPSWPRRLMVAASLRWMRTCMGGAILAWMRRGVLLQSGVVVFTRVSARLSRRCRPWTRRSSALTLLACIGCRQGIALARGCLLRPRAPRPPRPVRWALGRSTVRQVEVMFIGATAAPRCGQPCRKLSDMPLAARTRARVLAPARRVGLLHASLRRHPRRPMLLGCAWSASSSPGQLKSMRLSLACAGAGGLRLRP
jgi:hypothetical protein